MRDILGAAEVARFLDWLADDHFLFLGYRACEASGESAGETGSAVLPRRLGILREGGGTPSQQGIRASEAIKIRWENE